MHMQSLSWKREGGRGGGGGGGGAIDPGRGKQGNFGNCRGSNSIKTTLMYILCVNKIFA